LGHFSKMDKENECPKSKNATLSLFTVFYVGRKKWGIWELMYPQNGT